MTVVDQLALFEPEGAEAQRLLSKYLVDADRHARCADRYELLGMHGAANLAESRMFEAVQHAQLFALLLDLEWEAQV
jgi:hypothetical protein